MADLVNSLVADMTNPIASGAGAAGGIFLAKMLFPTLPMEQAGILAAGTGLAVFVADSFLMDMPPLILATTLGAPAALSFGLGYNLPIEQAALCGLAAFGGAMVVSRLMGSPGGNTVVVKTQQ